jgi:DNA helicase-2/ATP-dependent DNA helicase PcrA
VRLQTNYRSTVQILDAANNVIRRNASRHDKELESAKGHGAPVRYFQLKDEEGEAWFVVQEIDKLIKLGAKAEDFAILCRTAVQFRAFEAELRHHGLPYSVSGGMSFFDRKEVRDIVAYLKLVVNPLDETSLLRVINVPARGVGKTSLDKVVAFATEQGISASEAFERSSEIEGLSAQAVEGYRKLRQVIDQSGLLEAGEDLVQRLDRFLAAIDYRGEVARVYADPMTRDARWAGVMEILNFAENHVRREKEPSLGAFLEELALSSDDGPGDGKSDRRSDAVTLMSLHAAKGLEFPHVFLVGMEEGLLPHARAVAEGGIEEERRIAYVGITRAMNTLTLSWAGERAKYGRRARSIPSRFMFEAQGEEPPDGWQGIEAYLKKEEDDLEARADKILGVEAEKKAGRGGKKKAPAKKKAARRR